MLDKHGLLTAPIGKVLLRMSLPNLLGVLSLLFYHLTDTYFISQLGTEPLAAISLTFPVTMVISSIALGMGSGMSTNMGRLLGQGDLNEAKSFLSHGLLLATLLVVVIAALGALTIHPLFTLLGAEPNLLGLVEDYMLIWYLGIGLLVIPMVGNQALRATGNTHTPAIVTAVAAIVNAILDPLLIFGIGPFPRMEMQGAAVATVLSWMITFVVAIWMLGFRYQLIARPCQKMTEHWQKLLHIARPAAVSNLLNPVANGIIIAMLARVDTKAVAAFGAGTRIEALMLIAITALTGALMPFIAQNLGASQYQRAKLALKRSIQFVFICQFVIYLVVLPFAQSIAEIFSDDALVQQYLVWYLQIVPLAYGALGSTILFVLSLNAYHRPVTALQLNVTRLFVLLIPMVFGGLWLWGIQGAFMGIACANMVMGLCCYRLTQHICEPSHDHP
ncbi:MATE family efflux transporter [Ferrimonas aestuarii]|uniref:MATE family efflux transporter n=1 Tax=Ferrimonas aestuarii TaxID=2569539 RepID=A0A4U1BLI3_9GAMM|nr:MATE family efflux transporter [Ferrimonas aestuarii]TKB53650.1 MATE family efflux transporter [Ferrimonas aestuarii]